MATNATRRRRANDFYRSVLNDSERNSVQIARDVEGIDEEVALLRLRLRTMLTKKAEADVNTDNAEANQFDFPMMLRGLDALRRLVEVKYRLGEQQREALGTELALLREELVHMHREEVAHDGDPGNR